MRPVHWILIFNAIASAWLAWLWIDESGRVRVVNWTAPMAVMPDIGKISNDKLNQLMQPVAPADYLAILERPIFAPDRRPPPPPQAQTPPPPPDPMESVELMGVFSGETGGVLARVDGRVRRVKLNDAIGAWVLRTVDGRTATFARGAENREIKMRYVPLGSAPVVAPNASGPPSQAANTVPRGPGMPGQNSEDAARENIRRRNEIRAARGLPLITE